MPSRILGLAEALHQGRDGPVRYLEGLDPGSAWTGLVTLDLQEQRVVRRAQLHNQSVLWALRHVDLPGESLVAVETTASIHQRAGKDMVGTLIWAGRFVQRATDTGAIVHAIWRATAMARLTGRAAGGDREIARALEHLVTLEPWLGECRVSTHTRAALAVALTALWNQCTIWRVSEAERR